MAQKQAGIFEIKVIGHLDPRHVKMMCDLDISYQPTGETVLLCPVADQAMLYGLLNRLRDLGVSLVSVNCKAALPKEIEH